MLGQPIFPGENGVDQLVEIIKILGTPTKEQIQAMNPNYTEFRFPIIKPCPWNKVNFNSFSYYTHSLFVSSVWASEAWSNWFRCSDQGLLQMRLTWFRGCWCILQSNDWNQWKGFCIHFSMSCETRARSSLMGIHFQSCLISQQVGIG